MWVSMATACSIVQLTKSTWSFLNEFVSKQIISFGGCVLLMVTIIIISNHISSSLCWKTVCWLRNGKTTIKNGHIHQPHDIKGLLFIILRIFVFEIVVALDSKEVHCSTVTFFFSFKNTWLLFYKAKRYTLTWVKRSIHAWNMQPEKRYWAQNVFLLQLLFCSFCAPRGTCFCVHQKHRETSLILNSGAFCHLCFFSLCYIWSLFNVDCISHKFLCQIRSAKLNFMAAKKCKTDMWYR